AAGADGGTGGGGELTLEELCAASCEAQESSDCPDELCSYICLESPITFEGCEAEYRAQQECYMGLEGAEFDCTYGFPAAASGSGCADEDIAFMDCLLGG